MAKNDHHQVGALDEWARLIRPIGGEKRGRIWGYLEGLQTVLSSEGGPFGVAPSGQEKRRRNGG